jgi:hypothetical protein
MDEYLALPDGAGRFRQDFSGPVLLRNTAVPLALRLRDFHPLWCRFPDGFDFSLWITTPLGDETSPRRNTGPTTPMEPKLHRFGLLPVRSPLLGESHGDPKITLLFSLPPGT